MIQLQSKPHTRPRQPVDRARRARLGVVALLGAQLMLGCSLGVVRTKPRDASAARPGEPASWCTKSVWWPVLDLVGVAAGTTLLVAGISEDSSVATGLGAGAVATFGLSAGYGFATAPGCSEPAESGSEPRELARVAAR
jgi:hypothetical protein